VVLQSTGAAALTIHPGIWEEINTGIKRPGAAKKQPQEHAMVAADPLPHADL